MEYLKAAHLASDPRPAMGRIVAEGFYQWLNYFSKDKERLARAMEHCFNLDVFYVAVADGDITAIAACTDGTARSVHFERRPLQQHLGMASGLIAHRMLRKHLEEHDYPFEPKPNTGSIEFVATALPHRGHGHASKLIEHIFSSTSHDQYVLEVADTNITAVKLYEKLGFEVFKQVDSPSPRQSGFNAYLYMEKPAS
ncbi:MAG: GNAT family N-acetyltransferase [Coriobacteriales bacterium]|jgi:ribosomal protein S18 acetylase RimI-like enzyme|nr:GNAT family N-acetyltransferase [Coriobacteriales bacterium]